MRGNSSWTVGMLICLLLILLRGNHFLPLYFFEGLASLTVAMGLAILSGKIDVLGGLVGGLIGLGIFVGGGFVALGLLLVFFMAGSAVSHWRKNEKTLMGLEQENQGKRSVRHAIANGGIAAICGLLAWGFPAYSAVLLTALAASFASAAADTFSSELGNVYGRRYVDVLTFKPGIKGQDGIISLEGSLLGALGSLLIALAFGMGHGWSGDVLLVWGTGLIGNHMDSILGASVQRRGQLNNDEVNLLSTLIAAIIGGLAASLV